MAQVLENLLYTKEHEWIKKKDGLIISGITDYAQESLGDVVFVEFPEVGKTVKQGEMIASIESVKAVSEIYAPISGKIIEINSSLNEAPETINQKPYQDGWLFKIEPEKNNNEEIQSLLNPDAYSELLKTL